MKGRREKQITGKIFGQNCDQSFDGSEDSSVDDDGGLLLALFVDVTQAEPEDMKRSFKIKQLIHVLMNPSLNDSGSIWQNKV
jgi:hypothetical protein